MTLMVLMVIVVGLMLAYFVLWKNRESQDETPSRTLEVPQDYDSIQAAVDEARNGDNIVVVPGRYRENVCVSDKNIYLRSRDPQDGEIVKCTVIDAGKNGPGVLFKSSASSPGTSVVEGFTIINGSGYLVEKWSVLGNAADAGGGIYIGERCSVDVRNNVITDNSAELGGGIYVWGSSQAKIENNVIRNNSSILGGGIRLARDFAGFENRGLRGRGPQVNDDQVEIASNQLSENKAEFGGAISVSRRSNGYIADNEITDNFAQWDGGGVAIWDNSQPIFRGNCIRCNCCGGDYGYGGGISIVNNSRPRIEGNTIESNKASGQIHSGGGGISVYKSDPYIRQNIFRNNEAFSGMEVYLWAGSEPEMAKNSVDDSLIERKPPVLE